MCLTCLDTKVICPDKTTEGTLPGGKCSLVDIQTSTSLCGGQVQTSTGGRERTAAGNPIDEESKSSKFFLVKKIRPNKILDDKILG